jgi:hypothetical protein
MQHIANAVKNITSNFSIGIINKRTISPLGRWSVDKCHARSDLNSYYNNIDHCGTCRYEKEESAKLISKIAVSTVETKK